ncbi:putative mitochondrial hypothetical protein [Leptomonas pyrrhocoris]|uniref:Uncharacterized protein n=1 Tax=Leptomonas pyrrhocoris TaxID=157538 RepID=A0A0M9FUT2_LEPPY|nr:putative mitochondrial hypothetical protein [Leptomonas pyrrhocoris]KPA76520.1 putative mitochondrial hypothetical protein [Leptomonas pyrrhocoris]|eukprot:XP_015654959.1 putative mitochondrial hypothetical protein [Leptomonas pyrrhocoris]
MEKVVLTTYRKLYKMCCRIDASVAMRTQLVCCPLQVYDHRLMEWQSFDLSQMDWEESRSYLDGLIRRLNNGCPQYIPPLPEEAARAVEEYKLQCSYMFAEEEERKAAEAKSATAAAAAAAAETDPQSNTATASASTSGEGSAGGTRSSAIPLNVLPYSKLTVALRQIYEETPFSMSNVANSFAVVKELQYVGDLDDAGRASLVTLGPAPSAEGAAPFSPTSDIPQLQRALEVALLHNSLIHGLSAEQRVSLDRQSRLVRRAAKKSKNAPPASMAAATAAAAAGLLAGRRSPRNAFEEAASLAAEEMMDEDDEDDEAAVDLSDKVEGDEPAEEQAAAPATPAGDELSGSLPSAAELVEEPKNVQLLLSHPTARGFFRRTVLLMVRHVAHESAAFVLNKPLRNDEGAEMTIEATVRLGRVHPIFRRHLSQHTLMIGGPVMAGSSFDESIFLLHRVPGIPNALPLGSGLWMDGDLDVLMAKLDAKEVSAERDIIVLCGFAGWGFDQLKGELGNGYWVVASGPSYNPDIGSFVMSLAHTTTGQHPQQDGQRRGGAAEVGDVEKSAASPPTTTAAPSDAAAVADVPSPSGETGRTSDEESIRAQAQRAADAAASRAIPALKYRRRRAESGKGKGNRIETLSWVRAYASLGEPYSAMAMNQKAYAKDDDFQE